MSIAYDLSVIALRGVSHAIGCGAGPAALKIIAERFTNHSEQMTQALRKANDLAWRTLESALAGPSMFDCLKKADDVVIVQQVQTMLDCSQLTKSLEPIPEFRRKCLVELRAARGEGKLAGGHSAPPELAKQAYAIALLTDQQAIFDAEWERVQRIAEQLQQSKYVNLAHLLNARPGNKKSPILASSVRYFFRREVEKNPQLFQGMAIDKLDDISENQKRQLESVTTLFTKHAKRFEEATEEVLGKLGVIEESLKTIAKQMEDMRGREVEWRKEEQAWRTEVTSLLGKLAMQNRPVRPADSLSIQSDGERAIVKTLIQRYRTWPEEQRHRFPELLNDVGKLELATGDFSAAQRDFGDVAPLSSEPKIKAEGHFNAFQAALEQKNWPEALAELKEAVALDYEHYAPFPFAQYEPQRILGAGGFGVVFLCKHAHLGKPRVIKALRTYDLDRTIADVFSEATTLEQLEHPTIIRLSDCAFADSAKERPYLVMDFFDGASLECHVESAGPLAPADLLKIAVPIAEALQAAHSKGILHRDVKPGNVLVRREGEAWAVKLIDFGLAIQPTSLDGKVSTQGPQARTIAGKSIAGTLRYAAPEQMGALAAALGPHSDVYGFGKTCYYALFQTPEPDEVDRDKLPDAWRKFLRDCTAQNLVNRLPNFGGVLTRLRELSAVIAPPPDLEAADPAEPFEAKLRRLERRIAKIEKFKVAITCAAQIDRLPYYDYQIAAKNDYNVAHWRNQRFTPNYPECEITVLLADGSAAHGATKLATVRASYS